MGAVSAALALRPSAALPIRAEAALTSESGDGDTAPVAATVRPSAPGDLHLGTDAVAELRDRHLSLPVQNVRESELRDSFSEKRSGGRMHEAIDILAPRNTPVLAVEDGTVARFFVSKAGGNTIYQFDPNVRYVYYYAHLERYADGLKENDAVRRGQVLGYVGTSGNAPPNTPHLHFAIFQLTEKKQWWQGTPLNPYDVLQSATRSR